MMLDWVAHTRLPEPAAPEPASRAPQQGPKSEEERFMRETKDHWIFGGDAEVHAIDAAAIKAHEYAKSYSWHTAAKQYMQFYHDLANQV